MRTVFYRRPGGFALAVLSTVFQIILFFSGPGLAAEPPSSPTEGTSAEEGPDHYDDIPSLRKPSPAWEDMTPIARVGEDTVTAGDLNYALEHGRGIDRSLPADSLKRSLLERVIHQRLLIQEAYRRGFDRTGPLVNYAQQMEDQLAVEELRRRIYDGKIDVTEADIQELYERHYYTLKARHLSVDRRDLADDLLARLQAGEDFAELARRYSEDQKTAVEGGDMGEIRAGRLVIQFEDALFKLKPGELTGVIKGKGEHYKIFKLESIARDRAPAKSLEALRRSLAARVRTREAGAAYYAWQLSLFDKYKMEIDEESFRVFAHRLRDHIASWEAINAVQRDSLPPAWIFGGWPAEELNLELVRFTEGRLIVAEFHKAYRDAKVCPTCLWRDSDVQLRQFVRGLAFDKLFELEKRAVRSERLPALKRELFRRKEDRMSLMVAAETTVLAETIGDEEARAFWEEHKQLFKQPPQAKVRRIVVESEDQARDVVTRLEGGADFAALAEQFSKDGTTSHRGGETDFFGPGTMYGMADVALRHEVGELIPPFQSQLGWEVVVVMEKTPEGFKPFEEAKQVVKTHMGAQRTESNLQTLLSGLKAKTTITVDEENLARFRLSS
jgi:parvulin-like peptidyl-prolyl isomerase